MSPLLDTPASRRDALAAFGALVLAMLGMPHFLAEAADAVPALEEESWNGIPRPRAALTIAFMATTMVGMKQRAPSFDAEPYRTALREALTIAESMDYLDLSDMFADIADRGRALTCGSCLGSGEHRLGGEKIGDCALCAGTGRRT